MFICFWQKKKNKKKKPKKTKLFVCDVKRQENNQVDFRNISYLLVPYILTKMHTALGLILQRIKNLTKQKQKQKNKTKQKTKKKNNHNLQNRAILDLSVFCKWTLQVEIKKNQKCLICFAQNYFNQTPVGVTCAVCNGRLSGWCQKESGFFLPLLHDLVHVSFMLLVLYP